MQKAASTSLLVLTRTKRETLHRSYATGHRPADGWTFLRSPLLAIWKEYLAVLKRTCHQHWVTSQNTVLLKHKFCLNFLFFLDSHGDHVTSDSCVGLPHSHVEGSVSWPWMKSKLEANLYVNSIRIPFQCATVPQRRDVRGIILIHSDWAKTNTHHDQILWNVLKLYTLRLVRACRHTTCTCRKCTLNFTSTCT